MRGIRNFTGIIIIGITSVPLSVLSLSILPSQTKSVVFAKKQQQQEKHDENVVGSDRRRDIFATTMMTFFGAPSAFAYENAIPEAKPYADRPKRPGTAPKDLGFKLRTTEGKENLNSVTTLGVRTCDGNPNCFSTTGDYELVDRVQRGVDFLIPPWKPPSDDKKPLVTIKNVIQNSYSPGQGGIDGGGFMLVKETDTYLYYRFESLKKGYIDDVEFATSDGTTVFVRSASRIGYTDFGVNAIRLNSLASKLKGWTITEISPETHRDYWLASDDAREATFDKSRRELAGGDNVQEQVKASNVFTR